MRGVRLEDSSQVLSICKRCIALCVLYVSTEVLVAPVVGE